MAGLSRDQVVIDVVAAAEALAPSTPVSVPVGTPEPLAGPGEGKGTPCPFGHANAAAAAFCGTCGMRMDAPAGKPDLEAARPRPAAVLSPQEKAERDRQHAQALAAAAAFEGAPEQIVQTPGDAVLIHFTEDGLTAFGRVWYRGQELEIGPGHPRWPDAAGWITLSRMEQFERWGRQFFERGPWPGRRSYVVPEGEFEQLKALGGEGVIAGPGAAQLAQADQAEAARGRGVPAPAAR